MDSLFVAVELYFISENFPNFKLKNFCASMRKFVTLNIKIFVELCSTFLLLSQHFS